ncbi:MAG: plasmid stabilization protein [Candidatus Limnocylindria bacterium]
MPPERWSDKRERQYEHIKESARDSGRSTAAAKRIAAATVNKTRAEKGETLGARSTKRSRAGSKGAKNPKSAKNTKRKTNPPKRSPTREPEKHTTARQRKD